MIPDQRHAVSFTELLLSELLNALLNEAVERQKIELGFCLRRRVVCFLQ